ncbi:30S ribosomal protein S19 [Candidatus Woesearchaeota archaeon]|nr:30S ribosomal protein S19 [Candidatus Woesearchaeota archaeon]
MAKKEFLYRGKTLEELKGMSVDEFAQLVPARQRRSLKRGVSDLAKKVMKKINLGDKNLKTHARDVIIMPAMVGASLKIHNGKEYVPLIITEEMIGHFLGEFALTRKRVAHSAPGIGATKSSASISVK